jgi:hypothetical protein
MIAAAGLFLFLESKNDITIANLLDPTPPPALPPPPPVNLDIEPQNPLPNPPEIIKAVYATSWSAGSKKKLDYLINLIKETELNAIVIDVKDFSGYVAYNTDLKLPKKYDAVELRIPKLNALIKRFHDENIYVIARISVFQDQRLALARPDLALHSKKLLDSESGGKPGSESSASGASPTNYDYSRTSTTWKDHKGLMWLDTASREVWDYNIAIAREILDRGIDEVNFDYIRFASDGNLSDIKHPFWDEKRLKTHVVRDFFNYLRQQLLDATISADLFGLVTVNTDGLGIGQHLEFALPHFDAIAPMVYPSHYFKGLIGYENPAEFPYEVVKYSLDAAIRRMKQFQQTASTTPMGKLRPWLQDFDLGADYDAEKVRTQIQAVYDSTSGNPELLGGWMLWNPSNVYTKEALLAND